MRQKGSGKKGREKPSQAALEYYAKEREIAEQMGLKWRERGPRTADGGSDEQFFRGQGGKVGEKAVSDLQIEVEESVFITLNIIGPSGWVLMKMLASKELEMLRRWWMLNIEKKNKKKSIKAESSSEA